MEDHILVHGTLLVTIYEIDKLHLRLAHKFIHKVVKDLEEAVGFSETASKLYATIDLGKARIGRTRLIDSKHSTPKWDESFHIYCAHMSNNISFSIKEDQPIGASHIGQAQIPIQELLHGRQVEKWLPILHKNKPIHGHSKLRVTVQFFNVSQDPDWGRGIKNENFLGVPYTFFPQRNGCKVTLYQDAHVPNGFHPQIPLSGGKFYKPQRCWEDIFDAINNAKHFIYIAGWSIYTKILLIRDPDRQKPGGDLCLGEILKKKAKDGVRVLMLVWDDRTSTNVLKKTGIMQTHDEETEEYFYGSEVHCVLCPRNPDNGRSIIQDFEVSTMFTHHQKTVTVDCGMPNGNSEKRRVVSFVGGIDLCDGRYDTPNHSPFGTLGTTNKHDFHQPNFAGARIEKGGPRECWHDIHTRLEGPVAWDVLYNFEQRWWKQGGRDLLIKLQEFDETFIPPSPVMYQEDQDNWSVQLFRSIDGGAAFGFPEDPDCAAKAGLVSGKDNIIDRSIQDGYINAIRRAKNFIYIENQYFLGSSFAWNSKDIKDEEVGASHLIPKELSLKIVSKIAAKERFTVYVVIPMWPEGIPTIVSVQAILNWQKRTMEMMYKDIAQKLEEMGIQDYDMKEYLTFFCLGNREKKKNGEYVPLMKPPRDTDYWRAQESRRFMIYVHAKMMIVDDEYIIVGSANINQRSMDGARDSEIAMGAFQPHRLAAKNGARGEVYGFRMGLWFEHLGILDDVFGKPESLECVRRVNSLSVKYWNIYSSATLVEHLPGHLLSYPVRVGSNGELAELECFPDTKARVVGSTTEYLPSILTT